MAAKQIFALCFQLLIAGTSTADCTLTETGNMPLMDLGGNFYVRNGSFMGGLYAAGANTPPFEHHRFGVGQAESIRPLDEAGNQDNQNGRIGMISIGISNATHLFASGRDGDISGTFKVRADAIESGKFSGVTIVDCAWGGHDMSKWLAESDGERTWHRARTLVEAADLTVEQIQVVWMYMPIRNASMSDQDREWPRHAELLRDGTAEIARLVHVHFPNVRILFITPQERAYTNDIAASGNPEPWSYETAFGIKWAIERQIGGDPSLNPDPSRGTVQAPWMTWGPYLWTDGLAARSDGYIWECQDSYSDFTHASLTGIHKGATQLLGLMKTSPYSRPWFVRRTATGQSPLVDLEVANQTGTAPLTLQMNASASDPDGTVTDVFWNFGDLTFSDQLSTSKTWHHSGTYPVTLAVTDNDGNVMIRETTITVFDESTAIDGWSIY